MNTNRNCEIYSRLAIARKSLNCRGGGGGIAICQLRIASYKVRSKNCKEKKARIARCKRETSEFQEKKQIRIELKSKNCKEKKPEMRYGKLISARKSLNIFANS